MCLITAALTPTAAYISLSADYTNIAVDATQIAKPADYGTHTFTLTVNSLNFSGTVTQKTYNFNVIVSCAVTGLSITSQVSDTTYTLNQGTLLTAAFTIVQNALCNYPFTYTQTFTKNGSSISQPSWITFDSATQKFSMTITAPADVGIYTITSIATIP